MLVRMSSLDAVLANASAWTFLRSLLVAVLALPIASGQFTRLSQLGGGRRKLAWVIVLLPYLTPDLLVGYAWANAGLPLVHHPWWNETLYTLLVLMKFAPVATVIRAVAPPPLLSAEALHCRRLAGAGWWTLLFDTLRGPRRWTLAAGPLVFLLTFQEFEIASLMRILSQSVSSPASWTVRLYDVHVRGLRISESLRLALLPLGMTLVVLLPALIVLLRDRRLPTTSPQGGASPSPLRWLLLGFYSLAAVLIVTAIPAAFLLRGTFQGWTALRENFTLTREILSGVAFAVTAALAAYGLTLLSRLRTYLRLPPFGRGGAGGRFFVWGKAGALALVMIAALPGLIGSLILSLVVLAAFQTELLSRFYDTPLPLLLALTLFLLPRALLLRLILSAIRPREAAHLAQLLRQSPRSEQRASGRELLWRSELRGQVAAVLLLCDWGYFDLTTSALLAPVGLETAPVRLYNLMHYGQSAVLSAMLCATLLLPVIVVCGLVLLRRPLLRRLLP